MIANKLSILEETETLKNGCCIPVLQDTETKRISYKNLLNSILNELEKSKTQEYTLNFTEELTQTITIDKTGSRQIDLYDIDGNIITRFFTSGWTYELPYGDFNITVKYTNNTSKPFDSIITFTSPQPIENVKAILYKMYL